MLKNAAKHSAKALEVMAKLGTSNAEENTNRNKKNVIPKEREVKLRI